MAYLIALAALVLVPVLAIVLLRVNGAIAFMSLCVGSVLVAYVTGDVTAIIDSFSAHGSLTVHEWVQIGLLLAPFVLALLFTRGSVRGGKKVTNLLPALAAGLLFALLLVPLLPAEVQRHIHSQPAWRQIDNLQTAVVLGGAAFSLVFLLLTHRGHHDDEKHGKHH